MYKINDYIIYKREACIVKDIKLYNEKKYYVLVPLNDNSLLINVPISTKSIRKVINKKDVEEIIDKIGEIEPINIIDEKLLENEYKKLFSDGTHQSLVKIIKTTFIRNKNRIENKRKIGEKDDVYFRKSEKLLYTEFSISLNKSYEETKEYVTAKVENNIKNK